MPQIIPLPIRSFAVLQQSKSKAHDVLNGMERLIRPPRWVEQIRSLRVPEPTDPKQIASIMIDYGANVAYSNLWEAKYDGQNLFKRYRNLKFILQVDFSNMDSRGNLHHDSKPALVSGTSEFWFLHGLEITGSDIHWVLTPPEKLDPQEILAIRNVDLRREMIRKKGIEQVLNGLFHRIIDTEGNYSLLQVMLGEDTRSACNYLKMLNPSIGVWHMEGVPNEIQTVRDALLWRNNGWFVHADVLT